MKSVLSVIKPTSWGGKYFRTLKKIEMYKQFVVNYMGIFTQFSYSSLHLRLGRRLLESFIFLKIRIFFFFFLLLLLSMIIILFHFQCYVLSYIENIVYTLSLNMWWRWLGDRHIGKVFHLWMIVSHVYIRGDLIHAVNETKSDGVFWEQQSIYTIADKLNDREYGPKY